MTPDQILTLIVAFLGIAGTAVATTLSARLSRKSDAQRSQLEAQHRRDEILFEARRKLFLKFLRLAVREQEWMSTYHSDEHDENSSDAPWRKVSKLSSRIWLLEAEFDLIAPDLAVDVAKLRNLAGDFTLLDTDMPNLEEESARLREAVSADLFALTNKMSQALGAARLDGATDQRKLKNGGRQTPEIPTP